MTIETEQEEDGRSIAEVAELPGVMSYGETRDAAIQYATTLALRTLDDRIGHGEPVPDLSPLFADAA